MAISVSSEPLEVRVVRFRPEILDYLIELLNKNNVVNDFDRRLKFKAIQINGDDWTIEVTEVSP